MRRQGRQRAEWPVYRAGSTWCFGTVPSRRCAVAHRQSRSSSSSGLGSKSWFVLPLVVTLPLAQRGSSSLPDSLHLAACPRHAWLHPNSHPLLFIISYHHFTFNLHNTRNFLFFFLVALLNLSLVNFRTRQRYT